LNRHSRGGEGGRSGGGVTQSQIDQVVVVRHEKSAGGARREDGKRGQTGVVVHGERTTAEGGGGAEGPSKRTSVVLEIQSSSNGSEGGDQSGEDSVLDRDTRVRNEGRTGVGELEKGQLNVVCDGKTIDGTDGVESGVSQGGVVGESDGAGGRGLQTEDGESGVSDDINISGLVDVKVSHEVSAGVASQLDTSTIVVTVGGISNVDVGQRSTSDGETFRGSESGHAERRRCDVDDVNDLSQSGQLGKGQGDGCACDTTQSERRAVCNVVVYFITGNIY